jgi:hypothetical protein
VILEAAFTIALLGVLLYKWIYKTFLLNVNWLILIFLDLKKILYKFHFWDLHFQIYLPVTTCIINCYINTCNKMFVGIPWIWYFKMLA